MPEPIRVRDDKTGHEYTTYGTAEPGLTQLDEPAVDVHGDLIPPKYPTVEPAEEPAVKPTNRPAASRPASNEEH